LEKLEARPRLLQEAALALAAARRRILLLAVVRKEVSLSQHTPNPSHHQ